MQIRKTILQGIAFGIMLSTVAIAQENSLCVKAREIRDRLSTLRGTLDNNNASIGSGFPGEAHITKVIQNIVQITKGTVHRENLQIAAKNLESAWENKDHDALRSSVASIQAKLAVVSAEAGCE